MMRRYWFLLALLLVACGPVSLETDAANDSSNRSETLSNEVSTEDQNAPDSIPDAAEEPAPTEDASTDTAPDSAMVDVVPDQPIDSSPPTDTAIDTRPPMDVVVAMDSSPDVLPTMDVAPPTDVTPGTCAVRGVPGACVDTSICTSGQVTATGLCPGPANIRCCAPPNSTWCPTNGFPLPNEGLTEEPGEGGCRPGMIRVDTFCVDRFEASLLVLRSDGTTGTWSPYWHPVAGQRYRAVSLRGAVPQGNISGTQAAAACAEAGKRLCTNTEWLRACQGPMRTTYPYGNTRRAGVCNDARGMHPAVQCFRTSDASIWSNLGYPGISQQADSLDRTGQNAGCVTAEGALDMMGNLHEWTSDPAGTFRGGFYVDTVINGNGCLYATTAHDMNHWDYSTGFRCCANPM